MARTDTNLKAVSLRVDGADTLVADGDHLRVATAVGDFVLPLLQIDDASDANISKPTVVYNQIASPFAAATPTLQSTSGVLNTAGDLLYSTFLGGTDYDEGDDIAVDAADNAYVTGYTLSTDFPTTSGAYDRSQNAESDVFVVKLNASGTGVSYSTFLGGSSSENGNAITVDATGSVYVSGSTRSADFPTTMGAWDRTFGGGICGSYLCRDAFVVKLNASGSTLVYATFLGGGDYDTAYGIAIDESSAAYVTGSTNSTDFPTTSGAFDQGHNGDDDAFVVKLNSAGTGLSYATFLGGYREEGGLGIAIGNNGAAYVTGYTGSSDFPITAGAFDVTYNGSDADVFVAKLNAAGSMLAYSTFIGGGTGFSDGLSIAVDGNGAAYVTGDTKASDFPTTTGAFGTIHRGYFDAFVVKLNEAGSTLIYSTLLGGSNGDFGKAISIDQAGSAYVVGSTRSFDFPTTAGAFDTSHGGGTCGTTPNTYPCSDVFAVKLNPSGSSLTYASYLGGSSTEHGEGIAIDHSGTVYLTGWTVGMGFPVTQGAFDTTYNGGGGDAFVAKLQMGATAPTNNDFDYAYAISEPPANGQPVQILDTDTTEP